jgi:hypothetical protein
MEDKGLIFIEIRSFRGNHRLYLKETGDCIATFMNPREAFRTAVVVDRAMHWARKKWRKDTPANVISANVDS